MEVVAVDAVWARTSTPHLQGSIISTLTSSLTEELTSEEVAAAQCLPARLLLKRPPAFTGAVQVGNDNFRAGLGGLITQVSLDLFLLLWEGPSHSVDV